MKTNPLLALGRRNFGGPFFQRVTKGWLAHAGKRGGGGGGPMPTPIWAWFAFTLSLAGHTFTRASTAYVADNQGKLWQAAAGWPRFQGARIADPLANGQLVYNSTDVGGTPLDPATINLLMEPAATNLATYSEEFNHGSWVKTNCSVTANATSGPAGSLTADKLVEDTTNNGHLITKNLTPIAGQYTWSVYLKAGERTHALVQLFGGGSTAAGATVNLTTGEITTVIGSLVSTSCVSVGDGWWRASITYTTVSTATLVYYVYACVGPNYADRTYTGNGTSGIYLWGGQVVLNTPPTSYIPTTTAAATRAVDALAFSGVPPDNETRMAVNGANVDINDWAGVYPTPIAPDLVNSIKVYAPGQRPA